MAVDDTIRQLVLSLIANSRPYFTKLPTLQHVNLFPCECLHIALTTGPEIS